MAFPQIIDFDHLTQIALSEIGIAIGGWLGGQPRDEVALMNRLTERLARHRRGCDVGVHQPVTMDASVFALHRKGKGATDRFGADLALTVRVPELSWLKTAFFQLKRSHDLQVTLEKDQLKEATLDRRILDRSFVLSVDEGRAVKRVEQVGVLWSHFPQNQSTHTLSCSEWLGIITWIQKWFQCEVGAESVENESHSVEALIQSYIVELSPFAHAFQQTQVAEVPEGWVPARSWLQLQFQSGPKDLDLEAKSRRLL